MTRRPIKSFFDQFEFIIPLFLFIAFLALTLPGISWGAPSTWHPDEIVVRSIKALTSDYHFDEDNYDYPTLPQYVMYGLGKIVLALGYSSKDVLISARVLSAILAGLIVVTTYYMTRRAGGNLYVAGLSGVLLICVSEMEHNGRFAHNDIYVTFFTTLAVLLVIEYFNKQNKAWLYGAFIVVGMAASSKYIGGSLLVVPVMVYMIGQRKNIRQSSLAIVETLFIGGILTFLGYAVGTPKALFWMTYYFKRVLTALHWQIGYGREPDSVRGFWGQYGVLADGLGWALMMLFGVALVWTIYQVSKSYHNREIQQLSRMGAFAILAFSIFMLDLPMLVSYNYQLRYFLTLMPFLAVLTAFFVEELYGLANQSGRLMYPMLVSVGVSVLILYSIGRVISLMLLVVNDARIPASAFIQTLPLNTSLEHTYYPPTILEDHFSREHNYPIYFRKESEPLPTSKYYKFNVGEVGLDDRATDYLIVDSFTTEKFIDPYTCANMQVECDFFKQLATGQSNHYKLLAEFKYTLPPYLPNISFLFLNPSIRIYERIK